MACTDSQKAKAAAPIKRGAKATPRAGPGAFHRAADAGDAFAALGPLPSPGARRPHGESGSSSVFAGDVSMESRQSLDLPASLTAVSGLSLHELGHGLLRVGGCSGITTLGAFVTMESALFRRCRAFSFGTGRWLDDMEVPV